MRFLRIAAVLLLTILPGVAFAHVGAGSTSGFIAGLLHPLTGVDHLLAIVSVGLIAGLAVGSARWALPPGFVAAMLAGAALALAGGSLPLVETLIAASVVVFGALAALRVGLPTAAGLTVVAFFALVHGFAHGQEAPAGGTVLAYFAGFTLMTSLLLVVGVALGRIAPRTVAPVAGAAAVLFGIGLIVAS